MDAIIIFSYVIAGLTGAVVACVELSSKFSDSICKILKCGGSWFYLTVNIIVALIIFYLAVTFDIKISNIGIQDHPIVGSFITGLVSMGLLRSSIFTLTEKRHNKSVNVIINKLLTFAEKSYDLYKSKYLSKNVPPLVRGISFEAMCKDIIPSCMSGFTYPGEDNQKITNLTGELKGELIDYPEETKVKLLAIEVAKIVGFDILEQGIKNYNESDNDREKNDLNKSQVQVLEEMQKTIQST